MTDEVGSNPERKARKEAAKLAKLQHAQAKKAASAAAAAAAAEAAVATADGNGVQQRGASSSKAVHRLDPRSAPTSVQLSKALSYILRHGALKEGLEIRTDGFVHLSDVLARPRLRSINMSGPDEPARKPALKDVQAVVSENDKQRFQLVHTPQDEWLIRAVQGHSLHHVTEVQHTPLQLDNLHLVSTVSPVEVIHGTNAVAWDAILASGGLKTMKRNHIHLARGTFSDDSVVSGMRKSSTRLIYIDVQRALVDGIPFAISSNGVILTPGQAESGLLPSTYFTRVLDQHGTLIWKHPS